MVKHSLILIVKGFKLEVLGKKCSAGKAMQLLLQSESTPAVSNSSPTTSTWKPQKQLHDFFSALF